KTDGISYLFGVTGSGKTEVYLSVAERVIAEGKSVIYLVPEISLTHQLVESVWNRFKDNVAVLHSGLTPSQKLVEWQRIRRGAARFIIGARSAIFAPVETLGLVIIDEEHEGSYKSGSTPRYHARQVAMRRCATSGARLVMGSATPSVEAYHLMSQGVIASYRMPDRLAGGVMPEVEVVDMKREQGGISATLASEIRTTVDAGRQVILFLNRRGFSYFFHCRSCGYEMTCSRCSVSLTFHKERNRMVCHYCGSSRGPVEVCPDCGSLDVGYSGFGTEMVEEEVKRRFPDLRTIRIDTDAVRKKGQLKETLKRFRAGEIDVLLGTQMVAKGLNFPGVKLVGIVLADTGLHLPDFRAQERTFSLIVQVAGRAGRYVPDGKVVIQTYRPDVDAVRLAAAHDLTTFYERELETRRALEFPPFSRLIRLVFRGRDRERVLSTASSYAEGVTATLREGEVLGPAECPVAVISGNYRVQVIVRSSSFSASHRSVTRVAREGRPERGVYVELDVDPVSLL
ncbi:MAG TPA: primosomal protein N', partial [Spirochaetia bacterium]|nr:primosomal protein N' [Spirochaetia bacterium]